MKTNSSKRIADRMDPTMDLLKEAVKGTSVAITTDIWSSDNKDAYLDISIHWIDDNFILNHGVADFILLRGSHTAENIAHEIRTVIDEWKLNISAIVTDNGPNMTAAVRELNLSNVRCAIHTLQLSIKNTLERTTSNHYLLNVEVDN